MIIKLVDGGIEDVHSDTRHYSDCETCDYGSKYTNEVWVLFKNSPSLYFEVSAMYEYPMSISDLMKLFTCNLDHIKTLTEEGFKCFLKEKLLKKYRNIEFS